MGNYHPFTSWGLLPLLYSHGISTPTSLIGDYHPLVLADYDPWGFSSMGLSPPKTLRLGITIHAYFRSIYIRFIAEQFCKELFLEYFNPTTHSPTKFLVRKAIATLITQETVIYSQNRNNFPVLVYDKRSYNSALNLFMELKDKLDLSSLSFNSIKRKIIRSIYNINQGINYIRYRKYQRGKNLKRKTYLVMACYTDNFVIR